MRGRICHICEELCSKELTVNEQLISTKLLDSFKLMELICNLEEEFHITFRPEDIMNLECFSTVEKISSLVDSRLTVKDV